MGTINYSVITFIILVMVIFPIPVLFLDFLLLINLVFSFLLLLDVCFSKKRGDYSLFANFLIVFTIVNLSINIVITRHILTLGEDFFDIVIRSAVLPLTGLKSDWLTGILVILIVLAAIYLFFIRKIINRMFRITSFYNQQVKQEKTQEIEAQYYTRVITEEEASDRKDNLASAFDFFGTLEDAIRLLSLYEKFRLVFIFLNSAGGYFIGTRIKNETANDAFINYISLAIGSGVLSLVCGIFLAAAINVFAGRVKTLYP